MVGTSSLFVRTLREGKTNWMNLGVVIQFFGEFIARSYVLFPIIQLIQNKLRNKNPIIVKFLGCFLFCIFIQNLGFFFPNLLQLANTFAPLCCYLIDFVLPVFVYFTFWKEKVTIWTKIGLGLWLTFYAAVSLVFLIGGLNFEY